jgi:hypothetical protein
MKEPVGVRVRLQEGHPWDGHTGEIVRWGSTRFGRRPVVLLDPADDVPDGHQCFIMRPSDAEVITEQTAC